MSNKPSPKDYIPAEADTFEDSKIKDNAEELYQKLTFDITTIPTSPKYTPEQIIQGCAYYVVLGNVNRAARFVGIPAQTIYDWTKKEWFKQLTKQVRDLKQDELDSKLTEIIMKGSELILDRIEHGDVKVVNGEERRIGMGADILARVIGIAYDKRALSRGDPTSRTDSKGSQQEILKALEDKFAQMVENSQPRPIEGEVVKDD